MKTLHTIIFALVATLLLVWTPDIHAQGSISREYVQPTLYIPLGSTATFRVASEPAGRQIVVKVYELHPSGNPALHKVVSKTVITKSTSTVSPSALLLRVRNLKVGNATTGTGIRYAFSVTPYQNRQTTVWFAAVAPTKGWMNPFIPAGKTALTTPYPAPASVPVTPPLVLELL